MTQLLEQIALPDAEDVEKEECVYDHESKGVDNNLTASSAKLRTALAGGKSTQLWDYDANNEVIAKRQKITTMEGHEYGDHSVLAGNKKITFKWAAHHVIPTKSAFLKDTNKLRPYVDKGKELIEGDIGYDINGAENGAWLPNAKLDQDDAEALMSKLERQMHQWDDCHQAYSEFVVKVLSKAKPSLKSGVYLCSDCKKKKDKFNPPHLLVRRINGISKRIRGYLLQKDPANWRDPLFVSQYAQRYAASMGVKKKVKRKSMG